MVDNQESLIYHMKNEKLSIHGYGRLTIRWMINQLNYTSAVIYTTCDPAKSHGELSRDNDYSRGIFLSNITKHVRLTGELQLHKGKHVSPEHDHELNETEHRGEPKGARRSRGPTTCQRHRISPQSIVTLIRSIH